MGIESLPIFLERKQVNFQKNNQKFNEIISLDQIVKPSGKVKIALNIDKSTSCVTKLRRLDSLKLTEGMLIQSREILVCDWPQPTYAAMWHTESISRYVDLILYNFLSFREFSMEKVRG